MNVNKSPKRTESLDTPEAAAPNTSKPAPGFARLLACEHGGIAMEYVLLNITIMVALVTGGLFLFNPAGAITGDYGLFGQAFIDWYQRIVVGISLPLP